MPAAIKHLIRQMCTFLAALAVLQAVYYEVFTDTKSQWPCTAPTKAAYAEQGIAIYGIRISSSHACRIEMHIVEGSAAERATTTACATILSHGEVRLLRPDLQ